MKLNSGYDLKSQPELLRRKNYFAKQQPRLALPIGAAKNGTGFGHHKHQTAEMGLS
jgi:hypothetical protein